MNLFSLYIIVIPAFELWDYLIWPQIRMSIILPCIWWYSGIARGVGKRGIPPHFFFGIVDKAY